MQAQVRPQQNALGGKVLYQLKDKAIWIVFVVLFIFFSIANPRFVDPNNLLIVLRQVSMIGIAAVGMTFVILTGGIDLSVGSIISLVGVVCATLIANFNMNIWLAIPITLLLATLIGAINGVMVASVGIPAIIATFATQIAVQGGAFMLSGGSPVRPDGGFSQTFLWFGQGTIGGQAGVGAIGVPVPVIFMVICFAVGAFILNKTYFGRYFYAVGGNEEASRLSGIRIKRVKYLVYALSGLFAGLAGIVLLSRTNSAQPSSGVGWEFDVITCVVLGGVSISGGHGKISNVVAGVLIIGILTNGMILMNVSAFTQMVIRGGVLAAAVGFDCLQKRRQAT